MNYRKENNIHIYLLDEDNTETCYSTRVGHIERWLRKIDNAKISHIEISYKYWDYDKMVTEERILKSLEKIYNIVGSNIMVSLKEIRDIKFLYYSTDVMNMLESYDQKFGYSLLGKKILEVFSTESKIVHTDAFENIKHDKINEETVEFIFKKCIELQININPILLCIMHNFFPENSFIESLLMDFLSANKEYFSKNIFKNNSQIWWSCLQYLFPAILRLLSNAHIDYIDISSLSQYDENDYSCDYKFNHKYFLEIFDKYYPLVIFPKKIFKKYVEEYSFSCDFKFVIDLMIKYPDIIPRKISLHHTKNPLYINFINFLIDNGQTKIVFDYNFISSMLDQYDEAIANITKYAYGCNKLIISEYYKYPTNIHCDTCINVNGIPKIIELLDELNYDYSPSFFFTHSYHLYKKRFTRLVNYFIHRGKKINTNKIYNEYGCIAKLDANILESGDDDFLTEDPTDQLEADDDDFLTEDPNESIDPEEE